MAEWVNFAEIRERVSLEDVIVRYYRIITLKKDGAKLVGPCPVHNGDSPRAFHADFTKNIWHCFSKCKGGGNVIDFVAKKENISVRDAALKLQAFFLSPGAVDRVTATPSPVTTPATGATRPTATGSSPSSVGPARGPSSPPAPRASHSEADKKPAPDRSVVEVSVRNDGDRNPPLHLELELKPDHPHLVHDRGVRVETVSHFGMGYCSRGIMRGMIAIPIHDEDGNLVAYAGRRLKPQEIREFGKYKLPRGFRKEVVLYNLHRCRDVIVERGIILVEGFFTVVTLYEAGLENVVASMGCELSDHQAGLLKTAKDVIVLYDGNEAGWSGSDTAKEKLGSLGITVRVVRLPPGLEPEDLTPRALRWLVNGVQQLDLHRLSFEMRPAPPGDGAIET